VEYQKPVWRGGTEKLDGTGTDGLGLALTTCSRFDRHADSSELDIRNHARIQEYQGIRESRDSPKGIEAKSTRVAEEVESSLLGEAAFIDA
jgi:hypothetical protein